MLQWALFLFLFQLYIGADRHVHGTQPQVGTFSTPLKDGWGITTQGKYMVLSDGSSKLTWVDPTQNFKTVKTVTVTDGTRTIGYLNEVRVPAAG